MRLINFAIILSVILLSVQAFADEGPTDDRRPDLNIRSVDELREACPADIEYTPPIDPETGEFIGGSPWEEFYVQDIDMAPFLDRLYTVMTSEEHMGGVPMVAEIAALFKAQGVFDMTLSHTEYEISGDHIYFMTTTDFDHTEDTYYANYFGVEDTELRSAKYMPEGDYVFYMAVTGMVDKLMAMLESSTLIDGKQVTLMEALGMIGEAEGMGEMGQVLGIVKALKLDELLSEVLSGEIALALFKTPDLETLFTGDIMPDDVHAALMIGINDPEYVYEMVSMYAEDIGLVEAELSEGWHGYKMKWEEGVGFAFNDEIMIATPDFEGVGEYIQQGLDSGGLDLPACQFHLDLDVAALHEQLIAPLAEFGTAQIGEDIVLPIDSMAYLLDIPEPEALGHITMTSYHPEGNSMGELEMKKSVFQYLLFYVGLGLCGAAQAGAFN